MIERSGEPAARQAGSADQPSLLHGAISGRAGGQTVTVYPGGAVVRSHSGAVRPGPGGPRGAVYGLSRRSARRFREELTKVDYARYCGHFITLTYPQTFPEDPASWYESLKHFVRRLREDFADRFVCVIHRKEFQRRGAPHYHCLLLLNREVPVSLMRAYVRRWWTFEVGEFLTTDTPVWTHVDRLRLEERKGLEALLRYVSGYLAKAEQAKRVNRETGEVLPTGRMWGCFGELPIEAGRIFELVDDQVVVWCRRVRRLFRGSRWLGKCNVGWSSYLVFGEPGRFLSLLRGLVDAGDVGELVARDRDRGGGVAVGLGA